MSISKSIELPSGVVVSFHRIDALSIRFDGTDPNKPINVTMEVGSYLDEAAAAAKKPVSTQTITVSLAQEPSRADLYDWLVAPMQYQEQIVPTVTVVNGVPQMGTTTTQVPISPLTGFNGADLV